ncbi:MAG: hypothetical protein M2R45_00518 [Verrucomicrobia subdivision 3 bacterium]|nr:hypothetical protein [Limisphaerales bacterium]MCS1413604.1 hypothetical protein [Limisphaerales bacterium]
MNRNRPTLLIRSAMTATLLTTCLGLQAAIDDGLVAHYAFENANSLGSDSSGNGHNLSSGGASGDRIKGKALILDGFSKVETSTAVFPRPAFLHGPFGFKSTITLPAR